MPPRKTAQSTPTYSEEASLIDAGYALIAGVDEVGRGTLAGPVVAGAAILPLHPEGEWLSHIRDSKQMTERQRETALELMHIARVSMCTGAASSSEIDDVGIVEATRIAMARAVESLPLRPEVLLVDALELPGIDLPQRPIIKGDAKSLSIAAASIVAKVNRDAWMCLADVEFPGYGFAQHKGYATQMHLESLERLGPCDIHRLTFAPVRRAAEARA